MILFCIQVGLLLLFTVVAFVAGRRPHQYVISIYLGMLCLDVGNMLLQGGPGEYIGVEFFRFALDTVALVLVVLVALRFNHWWCLWVGSAQFLSVSAHVLKLATVEIPPIAYAVMERWPIWFAILVTSAATTLELCQRRRVVAAL